MKNIILLSLLFFQAYCIAQENPIIDLQISKLNGSIKSIQEFHLDTKANTVSQTNSNVNNYKESIDNFPIYKRFFNEKGYETEYHEYDSIGLLIGKTEYLLDSEMKKLKSKHFNYVKNNFVVKKHNKSLVFLYDLKNRLSEMTSINIDLVTTKKIFIYNDKNNIIEIAYETEDGSYNGRTKYFYDKKGNCIKEITYTPIDNTIENIFIKRYNSYNYVSSLLKLNPGGLLLNTITYEYEYDSKNNWIIRFAKNENVIENITKRNIEYYSDLKHNELEEAESSVKKEELKIKNQLITNEEDSYKIREIQEQLKNNKKEKP
ncbi:hypothetical protein A8C32_16645 [Flavivirga aquatica]|uniref:Sugar-binding protein n=1 Tax=Flavivirga aquatica TaxID=1849968 RepID=A0A1E5T8M8_9FLAO|nr:hypothetical protein [Flavivirga aquatica]OEK07733.1 hypothetical protein A8C32_16645 [Flavivirga aquatica]